MPNGHPVPIERIVGCLRELGVQDGDSLLVHSSFRSLFYGWPEDAAHYRSGDAYARDVICALRDIVGNKGALLVPTEFLSDHHYAAFRRETIDLRAARSNRGFLTEVFLGLPDTRRSLHPIYNVAAVSGILDDALARHGSLEYSMDIGSPWWQFTDIGGKVIYLGVDLDSNSLIHLPEYILKMDYPRPVFFHRPHEFTIVDLYGNRHLVRGYLHAIRWPQFTVTKFCSYLNKRYRIYRTAHLHQTPVTVVDAQSQYRSLMAELDAGVSWYDAIAWS
jgi:aminoglycoside 3-N-acetyltransferase